MNPSICSRCGSEVGADAPQGLCLKCLLQEGMKGEHSAQTTPYPASFTAPSPHELAAHFPQLQILELLGQGGMGAVYKARQIKLDRLVALKILPPQAGRDPAFTERFGREARALARLQHPHIVAVHDFGEADGLFYFLMEYVDGVNLRHLLANGRLPPEQALKIVPQVCDALQYAHEEGVVHRDIKPENILVDSKGRVKIADFGLAKLLGTAPAGPRLTQSHQVMGTPHYMAPEQVERPQQVDHRADIYALGVVFYEMLTGELPLGKFAPPSQKVRVDIRLDDVVLRSLERDPVRRYQHVSDVKTAVEAVRQRPVAELPALNSPPFLSQILALTGVGLAMLLLGVGLVTTRDPWWIFGIPVLAALASRIPWQSSLKLPVGFVLVLGALAIVLRGYETVQTHLAFFYLAAAYWFYREVTPFFGDAAEESDEDPQPAADNAPEKGGYQEAAILRLVRRSQVQANIFVVPHIPGEALHEARQTSAVPPEERIVGLIDLTGEDTATDNVLIGHQGIYFHVEGQRRAIPYHDFHRHVFVNHGTRIYLGQEMYLSLGAYAEEDSYCEALASFLVDLQKVVAQYRDSEAATAANQPEDLCPNESPGGGP